MAQDEFVIIGVCKVDTDKTTWKEVSSAVLSLGGKEIGSLHCGECGFGAYHKRVAVSRDDAPTFMSLLESIGCECSYSLY